MLYGFTSRSSMTIFVKLCQVVEKFVNIFKAMNDTFWTFWEMNKNHVNFGKFYKKYLHEIVLEILLIKD